ncbi:soma ferritin-like [Ischnura elegans]|uniref:soma ferritin-like n=1 Tax=Ischnura elegans TaxID=197161 RepID=UPI001ED8B370|nr:soma ferritin-like [Ischnura elegans]
MDSLSSSTQVRQNFHIDCENGINKQINMELYASYVYLSMGHYFERDDVALKGFHQYFCKASDDEREHAQKLMKYQNKRGGRIILEGIAAPPQNDWVSAEEAMTAALSLEKTVNESLLNLHRIATEHGDSNFADFLETEYLLEQVESIKEIADQLTNIKRVGTQGLGIYMYDQDLQKSHS